MCFHKQADLFSFPKGFSRCFSWLFLWYIKDIPLKPSECEQRKFACPNFLWLSSTVSSRRQDFLRPNAVTLKYQTKVYEGNSFKTHRGRERWPFPVRIALKGGSVMCAQDRAWQPPRRGPPAGGAWRPAWPNTAALQVEDSQVRKKERISWWLKLTDFDLDTFCIWKCWSWKRSHCHSLSMNKKM